MKRNHLIANGAVFVFFLFMLIHAFGLHEIRRFGEVGSGFWPLLVLSSATILSLILLIREWRSKGGEKEERPEGNEGDSGGNRIKVFGSILCLLFYVIGMPFVGFILSTFIFILFFIFVLGERRKWILALSPPLVTGLIVLVFGKLISMPLPKGVGIFADFSRLFY
jgi:xanthine/uracil permease